MNLSDLHVPPHSIHAEQALIGSLMLDNARFDDVADLLAPEDFYRGEHRELYRAPCDLAAAGRPFDLVTMAEALERSGRLDAAGGLSYLGTLAHETPTAANATHYARAVASLSTLRRLSAACADGYALTLDPGTADPATIAADIEARIFAAAERTGAQPGPKSAAALLPGVLEDLDRRSTGQGAHGLATGLVDLDRRIGGMDPGQLILIGARPGVGKSALALRVALHVAVNEGRPVAFFSLEMSADEVTQRALAGLARVPVHRLRSGRLEPDHWEAVTSASTLLRKASLHIDETAALCPAELRARCRRLKRQAGNLGLIVVDYIGLMRSDRDRRTDNRVQELSHLSGSLKALAKEIGVPVLALSQLNRGTESRTNRRPMIADLRESGSLEQDADVVLLLYRDEMHNEGAPTRARRKSSSGSNATALSVSCGLRSLGS
jgi:replicative DNA helicase